MFSEELEVFFRNKEKEETKFLSTDKIYIVRVDGKGFSKLTKKYFQKPYDDSFYDLVVSAVIRIMKEAQYNIVFSYMQSDEISFVIRPTYKMKNRKVLSCIPSTISSFMTMFAQTLVSNEPWIFNAPFVFDARIIELNNMEEFVNYFKWRLGDAQGNSLNNTIYWDAILNQNKSRKEASRLLDDSYANKMKLYGNKHIKYPFEYRNGSIAFFEKYQKTGYNPLTKTPTIVTRRQVVVEPIKDEMQLLNTAKKVLFKSFKNN